MKSSFMSINSEYEGDSKLARLSRITTEDSVILSGGNDQWMRLYKLIYLNLLVKYKMKYDFI